MQLKFLIAALTKKKNRSCLLMITVRFSITDKVIQLDSSYEFVILKLWTEKQVELVVKT